MRQWIRSVLGIDSLHEMLAARLEEIDTTLEQIRLKQEINAMALADLRDQLGMPKMIKVAEEIENARVPSGDPQMGSF